MLNFLTANGIKDLAELTEYVTELYGKQFDTRDKLKPIERRLKTLDEHIRHANAYRQLKGKKPRTEAAEILFVAAKVRTAFCGKSSGNSRRTGRKRWSCNRQGGGEGKSLILPPYCCAYCLEY